MDYPDHIYFDLVIKNYQSTSQESKQLSFNETRNSSFIQNSGEYYMAITRFQIDTYSIPSYVAEIQPNQSDANKMIHSVSLKYVNGGTTHSTPPVYLNWIPVNTYVTVPQAPSLNADKMQTDSIYYYSYSFEHLITLFNNALLSAMTQLKALVGAGLNSVDQPFMSWNHERESAILYAEEAHFNIDDATHIKIYFNRPAYALFSSFPAFRHDINSANENIYQMMMTNKFGDATVQNSLLLSNKVLIKLDQEVSTISNITPVSAIVFTTSTIPIVKNVLSAPIIYNNGTLLPSNFNNNFGMIITDFCTLENGYKPTVLYNPSAEYRRLDLTGNQPLKDIDIAVWWRDKSGRLNPLLLWSGGSCSIKILFNKKIKNVKLIN
jgi:hypothetical protein